MKKINLKLNKKTVLTYGTFIFLSAAMGLTLGGSIGAMVGMSSTQNNPSEPSPEEQREAFLPEEIETSESAMNDDQFFDSEPEEPEPAQKEDTSIFLSGPVKFIGGTRLVGLSESVTLPENFKIVAEENKGIDFLTENVIDFEAPTIVWLGVSDTENINKYIDIFSKMTNAIIINETPVQTEIAEENGAALPTTNAAIAEFDNSLNNANIKIIDLYSFLINEGYETIDGLRYTPETYQKIWEHIYSVLGANASEIPEEPAPEEKKEEKAEETSKEEAPVEEVSEEPAG